MEEPSRRLIVASNRLPVVLRQTERGWKMVPGMGGLVTALGPVLQGRGGVWIGWAGNADSRALKTLESSHEAGYELLPVSLTPEEIDGYYHGFSNEVLWPLFHDLLTRCNFNPAYWPVYQRANRKFAEAIVHVAGPNDYVWVQDYHLMLCAAMLREMDVRRRTGFFLHIPFPPLDIFLKLPWRFEILQALLQYDLLGFQTMRDRRNFLHCVRALVPAAHVRGAQKSVVALKAGDRQLMVGAFPIGIDFKSFANDTATTEVSETAWYIHEGMPRQQLILGVDRLDYTKGIPARIRAVAETLERYPELRAKITLVQVVVPSRVDVPQYQELKAEVERLVGDVNGRFTTAGWAPIHYIARALKRSELLGYYRTCEHALITPLKDGMNLVAKEFCACSLEENSVLLLSEFAGAAAQMHRHALMVNPYDIVGVADAIHRAVTMPLEERRVRMRALRRGIQRQDVFWWVRQFLNAGIAEDLDAFPPQPYFVPAPSDDATTWSPGLSPVWKADDPPL